MKSDAPTRTLLDSGTTKKRERNLRLVLVMISVATFLGLVTIGPSPQITPRTSAQPPPSCVPPPAGLISWWPGDGNANDILDGNTGSLHNGATFAAGEVGLAFSVDGVDDYVEIPDTGNLSPAAITLDAWVNPDTLKGASTGTRIISKDVSASSCVSPFVVYSLEVRGDFGNKATFFFTTSDDVLHTLVGTSVIPIGSFSLLAATFDGSTARIYVNGALENSLAVSGSLRTSSAPVILGNAGAACRAANPGLVEFDGLIDEVEIFGRALFATEITAIFNAGTAGKCKGCATPPANMVGWWPGDNNTAEDITPSPDNGTLNGAATVAPGEVANAFSLNGTTAYVSAPNVAKINFGTGNFSIDAWIKTSNASTTQAIVDKRSGDNVSVFTGYHLFTFQGNLGVQLADGLGGGITATNFVSATNVANGVFNHVAVTVDRASTTGGHLYVNGVSVLTFNPTGRPGTLTNTAELRFGRNCPNTLADNFFNGLIDEVELFNVALTQPEVVAIYNAGSQGKCKCTITCPANITVSNDPNQCGAVVTYPSPTVSAGCGQGLCVPASGSFFPVGTTNVNCSTTAGPSCSFTVTVNDTQPPVITCPANQTAVTNQNACPSPACQVVNFPAPVATDNCGVASVVCNPPAGSCLPVGVTTVICTATDASSNTATCSFTVTTFDVALQDDSKPSTILLWNSITGQYRFCCNGTIFTGVGTATRQGCVYTLQHNPSDRRVLGRHDKAVHAGSGSLQAPPGQIRCTITDRNTLNDTLLPACQ